AALACSACLSAGAITSANMIGVSSGTTSSRGVRAVSWKRRCDRVASAETAVMVAPLLSGGVGEPIAGQSQVDVIEGRLAGADRAGHAQLVDDGDGPAGVSV